MGGDNAPDAVIHGADIARKKSPNINYILYGNNNNLKDILNLGLITQQLFYTDGKHLNIKPLSKRG